MPPSRLRIYRGEVRRLLQSSEMQRAVGQVADEVAARVRAALPLRTTGQGEPYTGLSVRVDITPNGGARRDRAQAAVVVEPPAVEQVRWPDRKLRFGIVARVAGEVSRR